MTPEKDVVLVFQGTADSRSGPAMRGGLGDAPSEMAVKVQEVADWFKDYQIDQIQVSISGMVQSGSALKLLINAQGQGGLTITLKPKGQTAKPGTQSTS